MADKIVANMARTDKIVFMLTASYAVSVCVVLIAAIIWC